ncbi:hypothetical protein LPJ64_004201 [Coemansia asiatica]|uniref:Uncharacterized protein n=1 Tax=Coemansia asiatica TaxID=1052880 RepID=A0A9W7XJH4_9FUNG|nr:hypothetical protein LPJ64_004201 [Coemansia asiatica]
MATFSTLPKSRAFLPKLKIPANTFEQELSSTVWVPNPETTKFKSLFSSSAASADPSASSEYQVSSALPSTMPRQSSSIYCSQCKAYYVNPALFYNHINTCSSESSSTMSSAGTIIE